MEQHQFEQANHLSMGMFPSRCSMDDESLPRWFNGCANESPRTATGSERPTSIEGEFISSHSSCSNGMWLSNVASPEFLPSVDHLDSLGIGRGALPKWAYDKRWTSSVWKVGHVHYSRGLGKLQHDVEMLEHLQAIFWGWCDDQRSNDQLVMFVQPIISTNKHHNCWSVN